jgi:hypothetical protein
MTTSGSSDVFSRPCHGLRLGFDDPSDKSLGYFQSSAKRGLRKDRLFGQSLEVAQSETPVDGQL